MSGDTGITPQVLLTNEATFVSSWDRGFLLHRLRISEKIREKIVARFQMCFPHLGKIRSIPLEDTNLRLWSIADRSQQKEVRFSTDFGILIYGGVGLRTEPPLVPFLMVPFPIQRRQD